MLMLLSSPQAHSQGKGLGDNASPDVSYVTPNAAVQLIINIYVYFSSDVIKKKNQMYNYCIVGLYMLLVN